MIQELSTMTSAAHPVCGDEVNQCSNVSNVVAPHPKVTNANKASRRAGAGKGVSRR